MTPYLRVLNVAMTLLGALTLLVICATVQAQEVRTATITFTAPTQYTDGTPIAAGTVVTYKLLQGAKGATKAQVATINGSPYAVNTGLQPGETCWQVIAVANGVESAPSNEGCKSFAWPPTEAVVITVQ